MKKILIVMTMLLIFWDILEGSINNMENFLVGMFICLFVYKLNRENFITK